MAKEDFVAPRIWGFVKPRKREAWGSSMIYVMKILELINTDHEEGRVAGYAQRVK